MELFFFWRLLKKNTTKNLNSFHIKKKLNAIFCSMTKQFRDAEMEERNVFNHLKRWENFNSHPFTFELFLPGCRGSWEEAGSRGSAGWSASWLEAAPAGAEPEDGEAALAFSVFWRLDTWQQNIKEIKE